MNKTQKADKAYKLYEEIRQAKAEETSQLIRLGEIFKKLHDGKMYKDLGYDTFTEFCADPELGYQKSTVYSFVKIYEKYVLHLEVPADVLCSIGHRRLQLILPLMVHEDETSGMWLERADTWSYADLINAVRKSKGRDSMPKKKTSFQKATGEIPNGYVKYVESCPCLLHSYRKSEKAHFPRTDRMGGKFVIPLCRECHTELHISAREGGVDTFFANNKAKIGQWLEQMIKDLIKEA